MKDGDQKRVCKKFFLKTLNISYGQVDTAVADVGPAGTFTAEDKWGKHVPFNKTPAEAEAFVKRHI